MDKAAQLGIVRPSHGALRSALLPIYATDQLIFFALAALPFIWLATVNTRLALYTGAGAYVGAVLTMQRSTPSILLVRRDQEWRVVELLDGARLLQRTGNGEEWISKRGRLRRWSTDAIRLQRTDAGVLVTGRRIDLQIMADELAK